MRIANGNELAVCGACRAGTEVADSVHGEIGIHGMDTWCWNCGATIHIDPLGAVVESYKRELEQLAVFAIAGGDIRYGRRIQEHADALDGLPSV